MEKSPKQI